MRVEVLYDILLDIHKAYNEIYWEWWVKILERYGFGPRT